MSEREGIEGLFAPGPFGHGRYKTQVTATGHRATVNIKQPNPNHNARRNCLSQLFINRALTCTCDL